MSSIEPLDPTAKYAPVVGEPTKQPEAPAADDQGDGTKGPETPPAAPPATDAPKANEDDAPLGPQGEKALEIWKTRAKNAEAELSTTRSERDEAKAKLADVGKSLEEQALAVARREGATEATAMVTTAATKAIAMQALLAEAKGRLADPSDAVAFLNVADFKVGADFAVDATEIAEAVTGLLARKPHLAVKTDGAATGPVVPPVGIGQGVREKDAPSLEQQIADAEKSGDFGKAMALKSNQLFAALTARPTT